MKLQKSIGWVLFSIGLLIIFWSLYSSYNIFTAKTLAPEIFKVSEKEVALPQKGKTQALETQIQEMIGEQLKNLIPTETFPKLLNLISWSIFAGLLIFGGAQISNLGIKLLKK